jgi:hypothetical protein
MAGVDTTPAMSFPGSDQRTLLVVWDSRTGAARALARAAADAAGAEPGVRARCVHCDAAQAGDVIAADALLVVAPENLGSLSGPMKTFFDRTYYDVIDQVAGRACAIIVAAGSDGAGAVRQTARILTGWRMREAVPALIVITHAQTREAILAPKTLGPGDLRRAAEIGTTIAAGLSLGAF